MNHEVIFIDDDFEPDHQPQQQAALPGPSSVSARRRSGRAKRTFNGAFVDQVQQIREIPAYDFLQAQELDEAPPAAVPVVSSPLDPSDAIDFGAVIVDGPDVYFIQELGEENGQITTVSELPAPQEQPAYFQPKMMVPIYTAESDTDDAEEEHPSESIIPEEQVPEAEDDYFVVDPLELSDIWNDLITANQEILILLELQDLKHHIVDARRIENQMKNMVCEYCPRILADIRAWDRHIKKIHFQTVQFECDSCDGKFKYFARFKDHLNGHTGERPYHCDECNHQYAFRIGFLVHKILDHIKLNGIYVCPKCELDCKNAQNYKLHIAKHIDFAPVTPYKAKVPQAGKSAPVAAAPASSSVQRTKHSAQAASSFYSKENERNKFLNVFESFSMERTATSVHTKVPRGSRKQ